MVDSRSKGKKAETDARDKLRELTGHQWERIPSSGALDPVHGLKGDLYIPGVDNRFCVEVKHYAEDQFTSKLLSSKSPIFINWWEQTNRQADQVNKVPLLIFKYDRSKFFVAFREADFFGIKLNTPADKSLSFLNRQYEIDIVLLTDFCKVMKKETWLNQSTN